MSKIIAPCKYSRSNTIVVNIYIKRVTHNMELLKLLYFPPNQKAKCSTWVPG